MVNLLYLSDANVLIDADRDCYPIDWVPEFWNWLVVMAELGQIRNYPSTTPGAESSLDSVASRLISASIVDVTPEPTAQRSGQPRRCGCGNRDVTVGDRQAIRRVISPPAAAR